MVSAISEVDRADERIAFDDLVEAYRVDGVVVLRGVLDTNWIVRMQAAIDGILSVPTTLGMEYTEAGKSGRFYGDYFIWLNNPDFRAFVFESPLADIAARFMKARHVNLFYDQLFVKEPGTSERTPWHHDLPY